MSTGHDAIDTSIDEVTRARAFVGRVKTNQVRSSGDLDYLKSVAFSWFKTHRQPVQSHASKPDLSSVDAAFQALLDATSRNSAKASYLAILKTAKDALIAARAVIMLGPDPQATIPLEIPPDFSSLAADDKMKEILSRRWYECQRCIKAGAHLAATVMMGGLLEALFVARANRLDDKAPLFKATATPIDAKTKKPLALTEWTLRPYIDVGFELGWITRSGKDVAAVLRDYRNYVHPEKERSHGVTLGEFDSVLFWEITKQLTLRLLSSV